MSRITEANDDLVEDKDVYENPIDLPSDSDSHRSYLGTEQDQKTASDGPTFKFIMGIKKPPEQKVIESDDPAESAYGPVFKNFNWGIIGPPDTRNTPWKPQQTESDDSKATVPSELKERPPSPEAIEMVMPWIKQHEGYKEKV